MGLFQSGQRLQGELFRAGLPELVTRGGGEIGFRFSDVAEGEMGSSMQIASVLTKEMMATPTISLAMMSLMQTLAKDNSPDMSAPRTTLMKRLEEVATKEWLAVLRGSARKP